MSEYSIAEATEDLAALIDRALNGEAVVITSNSQPIIELKPVPKRAPRVAGVGTEWLRAHRRRLPGSTTDAGAFVSEMRDDEWRR